MFLFLEAKSEVVHLKGLPVNRNFSIGGEKGDQDVECELDRARDGDLGAVQELLNDAIADGNSYPQVLFYAYGRQAAGFHVFR